MVLCESSKVTSLCMDCDLCNYIRAPPKRPFRPVAIFVLSLSVANILDRRSLHSPSTSLSLARRKDLTIFLA